ncbi:MAG: MBL fold metallo-hydrolase [bacterium]
MKVHTLTVGPLETNGYVLEHEGVAVVFDPGDEPERFLDLVNQRNLRVVAIPLTHGHIDHIGAVGALRAVWPDAPVICHLIDAPMLTSPELNLSLFMGHKVKVGEPDQLVECGEELVFGPIRLEVRCIPGHTPGQVVFVVPEAGVITGDTLFAGGVGRWDLPGGDGFALIRAIKEQLLTLPDDTMLYPGHGPATTIGREKRTNPFLKEDFSPETQDFF